MRDVSRLNRKTFKFSIFKIRILSLSSSRFWMKLRKILRFHFFFLHIQLKDLRNRSTRRRTKHVQSMSIYEQFTFCLNNHICLNIYIILWYNRWQIEKMVISLQQIREISLNKRRLRNPFPVLSSGRITDSMRPRKLAWKSRFQKAIERIEFTKFRNPTVNDITWFPWQIHLEISLLSHVFTRKKINHASNFYPF